MPITTESRKLVEERIIGIIADEFSVDPDTVTPGTRFISDLMADTADLEELLEIFERAFQIKISGSDAEDFLSVKNAIDCVAKLIATKAD